MSNILPNEAKKAVRRMYRTRFIIAGALIALFAAALCALSLLPSYLALHATGSESAPPAESGGTTVADRAAISSIQAMIKALSPLAATTTPTDVISRALSLRPSAITIDHISYSGGSPATITLSGSAGTREAINGYRQALSADSYWKTVFIPISDLTGGPGARFSITLSSAF